MALPPSTVLLPSIAPGAPLAELASLVGQGITFHELVPESRRVPPPPRFLFGQISAPVLARHFALSHMLAIGVFAARDVEVFGDFMISRDGLAYRVPHLNMHDYSLVRELAHLRAAGASRLLRRLPGQHVLLLGNGATVYGHWLIDMLPKFALLEAAGYDIATLRYLLPTTARPFIRDFLDLLGIRPEQRIAYDPASECASVDELLVPTMINNGVRVSRLLRDAVALLTRLIVARVGQLNRADTPRRIFLTRSRLGPMRGLANRARIEELARQGGFAIVAPETMPLLEQLRLFAGATHIMGEYGSALHGSLFSPSGTVVCGLRGDALHPHFIQSGIGQVLGQPTGYVMGALVPGTIDLPMRYDFTIEEETFSTSLNAMLSLDPRKGAGVRAQRTAVPRPG
jgi:capsular polysaccharide biosynthesis protein